MKEIEQPTRNNLEGIGGWLNPSRYGWERISYWFQRLTGVFLLIYFIGHVYETSTIVNGQNAWESFLELTQTVWGHLFLIMVIGASTISFCKWDSTRLYPCRYRTGDSR